MLSAKGTFDSLIRLEYKGKVTGTFLTLYTVKSSNNYTRQAFCLIRDMFTRTIESYSVQLTPMRVNNSVPDVMSTVCPTIDTPIVPNSRPVVYPTTGIAAWINICTTSTDEASSQSQSHVTGAVDATTWPMDWSNICLKTVNSSINILLEIWPTLLHSNEFARNTIVLIATMLAIRFHWFEVSNVNQIKLPSYPASAKWQWWIENTNSQSSIQMIALFISTSSVNLRLILEPGLHNFESA